MIAVFDMPSVWFNFHLTSFPSTAFRCQREIIFDPGNVLFYFIYWVEKGSCDEQYTNILTMKKSACPLANYYLGSLAQSSEELTQYKVCHEL